MCYTLFVHNLGTESSLPKTTFKTKIGWGWVIRVGTPKNILDLLLVSAAVEYSNFKFDTRLEFSIQLDK